MAAHHSLAPSSAVSSVRSYKKRMGQWLPLARGTVEGPGNQLVLASDCVKHKKVMQAESSCRGLGFLACHGNLWKAIKIQQQAVNRYSLRWLSAGFLSFGLMYSFPCKFSRFWQSTRAIIVTQFEDKFFLTDPRPKKRSTATSSIWGKFHKKPDWTISFLSCQWRAGMDCNVDPTLIPQILISVPNLREISCDDAQWYQLCQPVNLGTIGLVCAW